MVILAEVRPKEGGRSQSNIRPKVNTIADKNPDVDKSTKVKGNEIEETRETKAKVPRISNLTLMRRRRPPLPAKRRKRREIKIISAASSGLQKFVLSHLSPPRMHASPQTSAQALHDYHPPIETDGPRRPLAQPLPRHNRRRASSSGRTPETSFVFAAARCRFRIFVRSPSSCRSPPGAGGRGWRRPNRWSRSRRQRWEP